MSKNLGVLHGYEIRRICRAGQSVNLVPNSDIAVEADRISTAANKKTGTDNAGPV
jgi:hypothetical protein